MKLKNKKALEKELDCMFIRINLDEENFSIFKETNKNTDTLKNELKYH